MTATEYIIDGLKKIVRKFPDIVVVYAYNKTTTFHIVEVSPEQIRRNNDDYMGIELDLWTEFMEKYPDEDLLICEPSPMNDMENVLFQHKMV